MSWNKKEKKANFIDSRNQDYETLQNLFLILLQKIEQVKNYNEQLEELNYSQFTSIVKENREKAEEVPKQITEMKNLLLKIKKEQYNMEENVFQQVLVVEENMRKKELEFQSIMSSITIKEKALTKRFSLINIQEPINQESDLNSYDNRKQSLAQNQIRG